VHDAGALADVQRFITKRSGLCIPPHELRLLEQSVVKRMEATGCRSPGEYWHLLSASSGKEHEFSELLNLLTVRHTRFFRNPAQFVGLRDRIAAEIVARRGWASGVDILSAGCATGEEPYSIAMVMRELEEAGVVSRTSIVATDISTDALRVARAGSYERSALRYVEQEFVDRYIRKYCESDGDRFSVSPRIRAMVEFEHGNILDGVPVESFDVIFCRNVTIYFEIETTRSVVARLCDGLREGGYLISGGTECTRTVSDNLEMVDVGGAFVYRKVSRRAADAGSKSSTTRGDAPSEEGVRSSEEHHRSPLTRRRPLAPGIGAVKARGELADGAEHGDPVECCRWAEAALRAKDYERAERMARRAIALDPEFGRARRLLAQVLVNRGRLDEAEIECAAAVEIDPLCAEAHFLMGLVLGRLGRPADAIECLSKAVYLDSDHELAYFTLGRAYAEDGRLDAARRAYENALRSLERRSEDAFLGESWGLTRRLVSQACAKALSRIGGQRSQHGGRHG